MKLWREQKDTPWYVIGCDSCVWQSMALGKDHEVQLAAAHEAAEHPESRHYRNKLTQRFPERARAYARKGERPDSLPRHVSLDLPVITEAGAKRRRELVARFEAAKRRRDNAPRCLDCGVEIQFEGGRWTPALRCPEHAATRKAEVSRAAKAAYRQRQRAARAAA